MEGLSYDISLLSDLLYSAGHSLGPSMLLQMALFPPFYLFVFYLFILISWQLITLQYCSGFCHTSIFPPF